MKKLPILSLALFLGLSLSTPSFSGVVRIEGGAAPINNVFLKIKGDFEKANPGITLEIKEDLFTTSVEKLSQGKIDIAVAGMSFDNMVKKSAEKGIKINPSEYRSQVVGKDTVNIFAHKDLKVDALTTAQLKEILTGKAADWNAFGAAGPITLVIGDKLAGTNDIIKKMVNGEAEFGGKIEKVKDTPDIMAMISRTPGSVGIGPNGASTDSLAVKIIRTEEYGRPLTAAFKGEPTPDMLKVLEFAKKSMK